ncbi:hydrogenase maturation nickel metallochaperone HypA [Nocardia carnea]|uniref:hydrogenase maturation nickel metallochaperone HypA/HybF n=1 Tax=Nocardia carnea TaxID=37328 RepID=UPI00245703A0|nr:hydrogenase maturation nickel metallochaperone HypA [Nocardia carnea]
MHELAITQGIVDTVCDHAAGRRVHHVTVEVGELATVVVEALRFCFELATGGTVAQGASLEIVPVPGVARCRACGAEFVVTDPVLLCGCGSADADLLSGQDLRIRSMEVSRECARPADAGTIQPV